MTDLRRGKRLLDARRRRGWTRARLAEEAKCSTKSVVRAEKGAALKRETLAALMKALELKWEDLQAPPTAETPTPSASRKKLIHLKTGSEIINFLVYGEAVRADADVLDDVEENETAVHEAVLAALDVVERIKKGGDALWPRAKYEEALKASSALKVLETHGWLVEGEHDWIDVYGRDYDSTAAAKLYIRRASTETRRRWS